MEDCLFNEWQGDEVIKRCILDALMPGQDGSERRSVVSGIGGEMT